MIEDDADEEAPLPNESSSLNPPPSLSESMNFPFGIPARFNDSNDTGRLDLNIREDLFSIYKERVDPIFKALHWPTAYSALIFSESETSLSNGHLALESAICFTAVCSLTKAERDDRSHDIKRYRASAERSLICARFLVSTELVVLQAFVIYLVSRNSFVNTRSRSFGICFLLIANCSHEQAGLRSIQGNAEAWTLMACAIRIARAQGIPPKLSKNQLCFNTELQKRIWYCIGALDLQSALDRGTRPLLTSGDFLSMPLNVDDNMVSSKTDTKCVVDISSSFTDMSFCTMAYKAMTCQRQIGDVEYTLHTRSSDHPKNDIWDEKKHILRDFESHLTSFAQACTPSSSPLEMFTLTVGNESLVAMRLMLRRPLQVSTCKYIPDDDDFDVLAVGTEVLESSLVKQKTSEFAPWAWYSWVKWYALAVVLAELSTGSCGEEHQRAWTVAQECYSRYAILVADSDSGLLWKPIARLMNRVRKIWSKENIAMVSRGENNSIYDSHQGNQEWLQSPVNLTDGGISGINGLVIDASTVDPVYSENYFMDDINSTSWQSWEQFLNDANQIEDTQGPMDEMLC